MTSGPSLSVVVPNARGFPEKLVAQLCRQLSPADEVILVQDDGAAEGRWWSLDRQDPSGPAAPASGGCTVTQIPGQGGAAQARNVGWRRARHGWVLFLDDDVSLPPGFVVGVRAEADLAQGGVVTFRIRSSAGPFHPLVRETISLDRGPDRRDSGGQPIRLRDAWMYGAGAALLASRAVLELTGGFKDHLGAGRRNGGTEDLEFICSASRHTGLSYCGQVSVEHRDPQHLLGIIQKFEQYGRGIAHLASEVSFPEGLSTVLGYCRHILSAQRRLKASGLSVAMLGQVQTGAVLAAMKTLATFVGLLMRAYWPTLSRP